MRTKARTGLVVAAVAALALTGCSGKSSAPATDPTGGGDAGWSAGTDSIKIGLIGPMTGPLGVLGVSHQNSLQVQIEALNAAGGIGGAKLELVTRDNALDPGKAVAAANELAGDDSVKLVVGPSLTGFYMPAKDTYEQNKKINCQPAVSGGSFAELKYGFRSQEQATDVVNKIVSYLASQDAKSIGLIYENDDTGKAYDALLKQATADAGIEYKGMQATREDDQSHTGYVQKFMDTDAIFISNNISGAKTAAAAVELGYKGKVASGSGMLLNIGFFEAAGDAMNGALAVAPTYDWLVRDKDAWAPGYRTHIDAVVDQFGVNTGPKSGMTTPKGAPLAADCLYAYAAATDAAQSLDPDKVAAAIAALDIPADQTPSGNGIKPGEAHEFYGESDIHVYEVQKDDKGWFTNDLTSS